MNPADGPGQGIASACGSMPQHAPSYPLNHPAAYLSPGILGLYRGELGHDFLNRQTRADDGDRLRLGGRPAAGGPRSRRPEPRVPVKCGKWTDPPG